MDTRSLLFVLRQRSLENRLLPDLLQHYQVTVVSVRRDALHALATSPPDLMMVDVPSIRFDLARFFEEAGKVCPDLASFLLLGKGMRLDQLPRAYGHIRHPFSVAQLLRRLARALSARTDAAAQGGETISWNDLCLDAGRRLLIWKDGHVAMTPKQSALLRVFLDSPECTISRAHLMQEVWGTDYLGDTRTLDVHVHWLRKALAELRTPFVLETQRGEGYRLVEKPSAVLDTP